MASPERPEIRLNLLDDQGRPVKGVTRVDRTDGVWAASEVTAALPPASDKLWRRLQGEDATVSEYLLAAQLARVRSDPEGEYRWIERGRVADPDDPASASDEADGDNAPF